MSTTTTTAGYLSGSSLELHFGLGESTRVERLEVRWPSGLTQEFRAAAADRAYTIREGESWIRPRSTPKRQNR